MSSKIIETVSFYLEFYGQYNIYFNKDTPPVASTLKKLRKASILIDAFLKGHHKKEFGTKKILKTNIFFVIYL
jgi:hypothetical protein